MQVLKSIGILKEMAKEANVPFDKAATMVEVYERKRELEQGDRRSQPHEKDILKDELSKLDAAILRNSSSKEIAAELIQRGVAIRPNVQGVLSVISRTRKQLLLTNGQSQAA